MRFLSLDECERWLSDRSRQVPNSDGVKALARFSFPKSPFRFYYWARTIAASVTFDQQCLLWITEWGLWESSENWPLYDRLRRGYGEQSSLPDKPGHLFSGDEPEDLASFIQLSMLFGWGGYLLTDEDRVNAFISHDEYIDLFSIDEGLLSKLRSALDENSSTNVT